MQDVVQLCKGNLNKMIKTLMQIAQTEEIDEAIRKKIIESGHLYLGVFKQVNEM